MAAPKWRTSLNRFSGIYAIFFEIMRAANITVGKPGRFCFEPGTYAYVGSAQVGLDARVARHFRRRKATRWNIDWLTVTPACRLIGAVLLPDTAL